MQYGVDVSIYQSKEGITNIDWNKAKDKAISFAFIKATQANWSDIAFHSHLEGARKAEILCGAYHYMTWDVPAVVQARKFLDTIQGDDIPVVVLDFEKNNQAETIPRTQPGASITATMAHTWASYVADSLGFFPLIYTRKSFWQIWGTKADWVKLCDLWCAWYPLPEYKYFAPASIEQKTFERVFIPEPWQDWKFWQFTDKGDGYFYGLNGRDLDLDVFNGTESELRQYFGLGSSELPGTPPDNAIDILWADYLDRKA